MLDQLRRAYKPILPEVLRDPKSVSFQKISSSRAPHPELKKLFPHTFASSPSELLRGHGASRQLTIGVLFSGGPAAGGHNVAAALFDTGAKLIGFLNGPAGLMKNRFKPISDIDAYRNQGGFDLLGSGRDKIETPEQMAEALKVVQEHHLDGLVVVGGDDSNTNAALLAEYFLQRQCATKVVGVPKTIDGDLRSADIAISFGFDSACRCYAELIGNIAKDALSSRKYTHFIRLMGRSASHIALECAMLTHPNATLIGEERKSLRQVVLEISDLIEKRARAGKEYGVILLPEGLIEFMPELNVEELASERDPHGNLQISQIETEKLLINLVQKELAARNNKWKFNPIAHFFGYEGRACFPTNFDANYGYALGWSAALAIRDGLTGVICAIGHLEKKPKEWTVKAVPIVQMMHLEMRKGIEKPVIAKTLVDIKGKLFAQFAKERGKWALEDAYLNPGPVQFFGPPEVSDQGPLL